MNEYSTLNPTENSPQTTSDINIHETKNIQITMKQSNNLKPEDQSKFFGQILFKRSKTFTVTKCYY